MTKLLEQAVAEVGKLSEEEQDAIARQLLETVVDEQRWNVAFAASPNKLAALIREAEADIAAGRTEPGGFDDT